MLQHTRPCLEGYVDVPCPIALIKRLNLLVPHHILHRKASCVSKPLIFILTIGQKCCDILPVQTNRLEKCTRSGSDVEREPVSAQHLAGSRHHGARTMIFNRYRITVPFKPNVNMVVPPDIFHTVMHLRTNLLQLFPRHECAIHPNGVYVVARGGRNRHIQRVTAQKKGGRRQHRTTLTVGNGACIFNPPELRRHRLVGSQRMEGQLRIALMELQRVEIVCTVHRYRTKHVAVVRDKAYSDIRAITGDHTVGSGRTPFIGSRNHFILIKFRKDINRMVLMDIFKNIMIEKRLGLTVHLQSRQVVTLLGRKSQMERIATEKGLRQRPFRHNGMIKLLDFNRIFLLVHINRHLHILCNILHQIGGLNLHLRPIDHNRINGIAIVVRHGEKGRVPAANDVGLRLRQGVVFRIHLPRHNSVGVFGEHNLNTVILTNVRK